MAVPTSQRQRLLICGRPMSAPLRNVSRTAERMVDHFVEHVYPCATLPPNIPRAEITTVTGHCLEAAIGVLDGKILPGDIPGLARASAEWARQGIPLDTILHAVHAGFQLMLDQLGAPRGESSGETGEIGDFGTGVELILNLLDTVTSTTTAAYLEELRWGAAEQHRVPRTLTAALLSGHAATVANDYAATLAARYVVAAVHIPPDPQEGHGLGDGRTPVRRTLRHLRAELATRTDDEALSLLSALGGTILLPAHTWSDSDAENLVEALSRTTRAALTAVIVSADRPVIAEAADDAHGLLDVLTGMSYPPGVYRLADMAREIQLTRPGIARDRLAAMLDPLADQPELMTLLHVYLRNSLHRQATADDFGIHANTVDHRLKRIATLTGVDPTLGAGAFLLQSALIARGFPVPGDRQRTRRLRRGQPTRGSGG